MKVTQKNFAGLISRYQEKGGILESPRISPTISGKIITIYFKDHNSQEEIKKHLLEMGFRIVACGKYEDYYSGVFSVSKEVWDRKLDIIKEMDIVFNFNDVLGNNIGGLGKFITKYLEEYVPGVEFRLAEKDNGTTSIHIRLPKCYDVTDGMKMITYAEEFLNGYSTDLNPIFDEMSGVRINVVENDKVCSFYDWDSDNNEFSYDLTYIIDKI